jgi:hypothetical protein
MNRQFAMLAGIVVAFAINCAAALHVIRTIVDIADDLCVATLSDPHLDPDAAALLAGRTAQEACKDAAVSRVFVDQVKGAQRASLATLRRPAP